MTYCNTQKNQNSSSVYYRGAQLAYSSARDLA